MSDNNDREMIRKTLGKYDAVAVDVEGNYTPAEFQRRVDQEKRRLDRMARNVAACVERNRGNGFRIRIEVDSGYAELDVNGERRETKAEAEKRIHAEEAANKRQEKARKKYADQNRMRLVTSAVRNIQENPEMYEEAFAFLQEQAKKNGDK